MICYGTKYYFETGKPLGCMVISGKYCNRDRCKEYYETSIEQFKQELAKKGAER